MLGSPWEQNCSGADCQNGLTLLENDPHITTALVIGTILAVALFGGVAVGPLIGAGIAYIAMQIVKLFTS